MEALVQAILLALIQGLTEFLPISSSAHLILPSQVLGWPDQGQAFDVAVHVGTLTAVVTYFFRDLKQITLGSLATVQERRMNSESWLALAVIIATLPAVIVGGLMHDFIADNLRSSLVIAISTLVFGLLLLWSDRVGKRVRDMAEMTLWLALLIGLAQALALIPGTSRSGITITAALLLGFNRVTAARFSMLLSIPIILAAGLLETLTLLGGPHSIKLTIMLVGFVVSAVSAFLCIHLFLRLIERIGMLPFVIYRVILSAILFGLIVFG